MSRREVMKLKRGDRLIYWPNRSLFVVECVKVYPDGDIQVHGAHYGDRPGVVGNYRRLRWYDRPELTPPG